MMVWHIGNKPGDDGRQVRDENGLLVTLFVSADDARECVQAMQAKLVVDDMLAYEAEAFEEDEPVNGCDLVDAFTAWRERLKAALEVEDAYVCAFCAETVGPELDECSLSETTTQWKCQACGNWNDKVEGYDNG